MENEAENRLQSGTFIQEDDGSFAVVVGLTQPSHMPVERMAEVFAQLSAPMRLDMVLCLLEPGVELNVGEICGILKESQPAVSHHLAILHSSRIVRRRKEGRNNFYSLHNRDEIADLFHALLEGVTGQRFTADVTKDFEAAPL